MFAIATVSRHLFHTAVNAAATERPRRLAAGVVTWLLRWCRTDIRVPPVSDAWCRDFERDSLKRCGDR